MVFLAVENRGVSYMNNGDGLIRSVEQEKNLVKPERNYFFTSIAIFIYNLSRSTSAVITD
ncbi:hypothetical protein wHma_08000 [Wolbachia pipientis]|nr:hypothetical protein wHma_08000 [Wolbachia pipientis]